jgi:hypothetical protein
MSIGVSLTCSEKFLNGSDVDDSVDFKNSKLIDFIQ